jgi:hypothetical protein
MVAHEGTYTWAYWCRWVDPHTSTRFEITPDDFPIEDTNRYSLTNCLDRVDDHLVQGLTTAEYPCNRTVVEQPGWPGSLIHVVYHNCSSSTVFLTVNAHAVPFDGTFTYPLSCIPTDRGDTREWFVKPTQFPPVDSDQ